MPLKLRYKKKGDGSTAFTAVRGDGSSTTTQLGGAGGFGPVHDLAHYVVETQFGIQKGFLGLLAGGWSIEDFTTGVVDRMIREGVISDAGRAEVVAGLLSGDSLSRFPLSVEDFNWTVQSQSAEIPSLSADELATLRRRLTALREQWDALNPGETLELSIDVSPGPRQIVAPYAAVHGTKIVGRWYEITLCLQRPMKTRSRRGRESRPGPSKNNNSSLPRDLYSPCPSQEQLPGLWLAVPGWSCRQGRQRWSCSSQRE